MIRAPRFSVVMLFAIAPVARAQGPQAPVPPLTTAASTVTLVGTVKDPDGKPLEAVDVMVDSTYHSLSNAAGEFRVSGLRAGLLELTARRVGYNPLSTIIQADAGLIVQLAIKLIPMATELDVVIVEGKRLSRALMETGFYQRQKLGMGYFMDPDFLEKRRWNVSSFVRNVPSIDVQRTRRGAEIALGKAAARRCVMSIFVDGNYVAMGGTLGLDEMVNRDDLLAMEVYPHPTDVPAKYLSLMPAAATECGAIVMWTKPVIPKEKKKK